MTTNASTIRAGAEIFTLINVFSVAPDRQQRQPADRSNRSDNAPSTGVHFRQYSHQS
jgi:hypothetical protein